MTEDELMIPGTEEEDEAMLPDGWKEGDDFFADPSTWSGNAKAPDEAPETPDEAEPTDPAPESEAAPTTGEPEETDGQSAEPKTEEPTSGQTEEPVKSPRILKLKVNHGDQEVDVNSMSDEELAEFLTHINPTNCQDCAFSHGWRCQPNRDDYSDFEKCKEGRKRWLQQPAEEEST